MQDYEKKFYNNHPWVKHRHFWLEFWITTLTLGIIVLLIKS
jgi:hypothetical protein